MKKGTLLVEEGKTSKQSYFLKSGIARCFLYDHNGNEITTRFYTAPATLNDFQSFFKQEPSKEYYETLTHCETLTIDLEAVQYCFHNIPEFREWGRMMLTMNYVALHERMISFHKFDAKERYLELLKQKPQIIKEVPLKYVASYLGVTKYSLSRIRKEIITSP
ncbi:MAG: Crp/Fnr family transcriptional regulator [Flavobacteriaceae bacterium]|nr:Crp/Fnr family transcriptional regulator [Flavobacteriaceae bacterium]